MTHRVGLGFFIAIIFLVGLTPGGSVLAAPPNAPTPPTGVTVYLITPTQTEVTWVDASSDEDYFIIERSDAGINYTPIATVPANTVRFVDSGVRICPSGLRVYYRVRAFSYTGGQSSAASGTSGTWPWCTPSPTPSNTATVTVTPTVTQTVTVTPTPRNQMLITLASGDALLIRREIDYSAIAITGAVAMLIILVVIFGIYFGIKKGLS